MLISSGRRAIGQHRAVAVVSGIGRPPPPAAVRKLRIGPLLEGGCGSLPAETPRAFHRGFAPDELSSSPARACTHGPPVSLQPAELKMVISSPSRSASDAACRTASSHSGVPNTIFFSTVWPLPAGDVSQLHAADADALHPLQVFGDAFLGDVAAGPVPPGPRLGRIRRVPETLFRIRRPCLGRRANPPGPTRRQ